MVRKGQPASAGFGELSRRLNTALFPLPLTSVNNADQFVASTADYTRYRESPRETPEQGTQTSETFNLHSPMK